MKSFAIGFSILCGKLFMLSSQLLKDYLDKWEAIGEVEDWQWFDMEEFQSSNK